MYMYKASSFEFHSRVAAFLIWNAIVTFQNMCVEKMCHGFILYLVVSSALERCW